MEPSTEKSAPPYEINRNIPDVSQEVYWCFTGSILVFLRHISKLFSKVSVISKKNFLKILGNSSVDYLQGTFFDFSLMCKSTDGLYSGGNEPTC